jgi:excisionase family DNA binding protein
MENRERLVLTVSETSRILGLSRNATYEGVHTGQIPHLKIGKRILIPRAALERLLDDSGKTKE